MSNEKFLIFPAAGDIDEDEGQTLRQIYDQLKARFEPSGEDTSTVHRHDGVEEIASYRNSEQERKAKANLPAHLVENYLIMPNDELLEELEYWAGLCHYDPHNQSDVYNPFEVIEVLRAEVLKRMENTPSEQDDD